MSDRTVPSLPPSDEYVRRRMRTQRRVDTTPELALRQILHSRGMRYRVGYRIPGAARRTIDIAFTARRIAVFVDGCFWHRCPEHFVPVKNNSSWWAEKLNRNVERDAETTAFLEQSGWRVVRVWEHEPAVEAADRVQSVWNESDHRPA